MSTHTFAVRLLVLKYVILAKLATTKSYNFHLSWLGWTLRQ